MRLEKRKNGEQAQALEKLQFGFNYPHENEEVRFLNQKVAALKKELDRQKQANVRLVEKHDRQSA